VISFSKAAMKDQGIMRIKFNLKSRTTGGWYLSGVITEKSEIETRGSLILLKIKLSSALFIIKL
jgi:hypothetical protein